MILKSLSGTDGDVYIPRQEWFVVARDKNKFTSNFVKKETTSWMVYGHLSSYGFWVQHADKIEAAEKALRVLKIQDTLLAVDTELQNSPMSMTANPNCTWAHLALHQYRHYPTEHRLDFGVASDSLLPVVLTKWMCLGKGQSRRGGKRPKHSKPSPYGTLPAVYPFGPGSIMAAFEGVGDGDKTDQSGIQVLNRYGKTAK